MFKSKIRILAATLVSIMLFSACATPTSVQAQADEVPTIRVQGNATITVAPDIAKFNLGVSTTGASADRALMENTALMNHVIAAVQGFGIDESDISTNQFTIQQMFHPVFDRFHMMEMGGENQYTVTNSITVTVRDLDTIGSIIAAGVGAGANMSGNVWFNAENAGELYYEALALAVEDAARKSQVLSTALNTSITGLVSLSETSGWGSPALTRGQGFALDSALWMMRQANEWSPPVHGRYVEVTARVEVVYSVAR